MKERKESCDDYRTAEPLKNVCRPLHIEHFSGFEFFLHPSRVVSHPPASNVSRYFFNRLQDCTTHRLFSPLLLSCPSRSRNGFTYHKFLFLVFINKLRFDDLFFNRVATLCEQF